MPPQGGNSILHRPLRMVSRTFQSSSVSFPGQHQQQFLEENDSFHFKVNAESKKKKMRDKKQKQQNKSKSRKNGDRRRLYGEQEEQELSWIRRSDSKRSVSGSAAAAAGGGLSSTTGMTKHVSFDMDSTREYEICPLTDMVSLTDIWYDVEEFKRMRSDEKDMAELMGWGYIQTKDQSSSQRGLEHTIPSLKKLRRKNIQEGQKVVLKHQHSKSCNSNKLAKLYKSKVKKCQKDAYHVGLADAAAVGMILNHNIHRSLNNNHNSNANNHHLHNGTSTTTTSGGGGGGILGLVRLKRRFST